MMRRLTYTYYTYPYTQSYSNSYSHIACKRRVAWQVAGSRQRVCFVCKELLRNLIYLHVAVVVLVLLLPLVLLVVFPCLLSANEMRLLPSAAAWTRPQLNELLSAGFDVVRFLLHFKRFSSHHLVFSGFSLLLLLFLLFFFALTQTLQTIKF